MTPATATRSIENLWCFSQVGGRPMKVYITNSIIGSVKRSRGCIGCVFVMSAFLSVRLRFPIKAAMHKGTLEMKLALFQFAKVFAHNQALYKPLQRQVSQAEVTRRAVKANVKVILPRPAWLAWCKRLAVQGTASKSRSEDS